MEIVCKKGSQLAVTTCKTTPKSALDDSPSSLENLKPLLSRRKRCTWTTIDSLLRTSNPKGNSTKLLNVSIFHAENDHQMEMEE